MTSVNNFKSAMGSGLKTFFEIYETDMIDFVIDKTVTINSLEGIQMGTVQYYYNDGYPLSNVSFQMPVQTELENSID